MQMKKQDFMMLVLFYLILSVRKLSAKSLVEEYSETLVKYIPEDQNPEPKHLHRERFKNFKRFKRAIDAINTDPDLTYHAETNMFSVLTEAERQSYTAGINTSSPNYDHDITISPRTDDTMPDSLDWLDRGVVVPVRLQGRCGSCWAIAAATSLESFYFRETGRLVNFSVEELKDCSDIKLDNGCEGSWPSKAFRYLIRHGRLSTEAEYPYKPKPHVCWRRKPENALKDLRVTGYNKLEGDYNLKLALNQGIVAAAISTTESLFTYKGGIYNDLKSCNKNRVSHGVSVVGYASQNGYNFWNVKNSWGPKWGENGYVKLSRDLTNICHISDFIYLPTVE